MRTWMNKLIYVRGADAEVWRDFEVTCRLAGKGVSATIIELIKEYLIQRKRQ